MLNLLSNSTIFNFKFFHEFLNHFGFDLALKLRSIPNP